jgi:hypothetical protein
VFEMMRDNIDQHKFNAFPAPYLPKVGSVLPLRFRDAIYRMIGSNAGQEIVPRGLSISVKIVPCGINDDIQVSRECVHHYPSYASFA